MASRRHRDHVYAAAETIAGANAPAHVLASWRRSLKDYHVDPSSVRPPYILTQSELNGRLEPLGGLIDVGRGELNQLYSLVRATNYVVLLCDVNGVAIDHRGNDLEADRFRSCGIWLGGVWSEGAEGTNGIGTSISELRPITVHRDEHFRTRHAGLSCSGAPIFGPDGELAGVLDVSSMDPQLSEAAHALSLPITVGAARAIEERLFRQAFGRAWIVVLAQVGGDDAAMMLALDADQRIVGADRNARRALTLEGPALRDGCSLWAHFERNTAYFRSDAGDDVPTQLRSTRDASLWSGIVTPPAVSPRAGGRVAAFHIRPRIALLGDIQWPTSSPQIRGGLPPSILRRVQNHIDQQLQGNISLAKLSEIAGLSVWHFAHAFKETVGMAPHAYLLQRRVERANEMLATTNHTLSEIALAAGFTDQSHFARHFRRRFGDTPGRMRRSSALAGNL